MFSKSVFAALAIMSAASAFAVIDVKVVKEGVEKIPVSIDVKGDPSFAKSLRRNLELAGAFQVRKDGASIKVTGSVGSSVRVEGRGKALTLPSSAADGKAARMEARRLADRMCETYAKQRGFACDQMAFVSKEGRAGELCTCYPDGYDIRKLTNDAKESVGPRWSDSRTLFYTGFLKAGPQVYELDVQNGRRKLKWSFKGLTTGATVSPDGKRVAIILSVHGNPELYVIEMASGSWTRLTTTKNASEGQPCWSPDGRQIVYVSDETRHPQLYIVDVATKKTRRLTTRGSQNVDPDWGPDGRITYISKRMDGSAVAVLDPAKGEASARLVTKPGAWEHPSWSRDGRHLVASRDNALFVVDTLEDGDDPRAVFLNSGRWITPTWRR
ncbi:MAG: hypothetical protein E7049_06730 [Lentisphaerae bacterium]|jgi:TolB protein|nr:hypothetical protein [Lentisphaerota bacterium]